MQSKRKYWHISTLVSFLLTAVLVYLWVLMNNYRLGEPQVSSPAQAMQVIEKARSQNFQGNNADPLPLQTLKTGVYIQSLQFFNSTDVNVSGYIWQKYECLPSFQTQNSAPSNSTTECHNPVLPIPNEDEVGFILPEQVYSGSDISPHQVYRMLSANKQHFTIGWYFEATLRQPFEYTLYPFDHKTVWIRMWPKAFSENLVLIPDYEAYESTGISDVFGIEKDIVLGTWKREDTYFDYQFSDYDTNFGIDEYIGKSNFPELRYNIVVKRKFGNAFIVYLLPLLLVAALLFAVMLTVTDDKRISEKIGFSASGFIGAASALFFVVLLAHIQLREQFSGSGIVYIEYFYIWMYMLLVVTTANTYLFSVHSNVFNGLLLKNDNLLPKVLFWPVLISGLILISLKVMCSSVLSGVLG